MYENSFKLRVNNMEEKRLIEKIFYLKKKFKTKNLSSIT